MADKPPLTGTEPRCEFCTHAAVIGKDTKGESVLECHRYPPRVAVFMLPPQIAGGKPRYQSRVDWPRVQTAWSCGEFKGPVDLRSLS